MRRRFARLIPLATLVAGLAAGCSSAPSGPYLAEPEVGQCWDATQADAAEWMDWQGSGPVECSKEHTLETVGVLPVEGDYAPTGLAGTKTYPEEFIAASSETCDEAWTKASDWAKRPNRLSNFFFYPSPSKFNAGERWVRCDIGIFDVGTRWAQEDHQLQVLTKTLAELKKEQQKDPTVVALCLDSRTNTEGLLGETLRVVDCNEPHRWEMVLESDLGSDDEAWPGEEEVQSRAEEACTADMPKSVTGWFWTAPSEGEWAKGKRSSFCWWAEVPVTAA